MPVSTATPASKNDENPSVDAPLRTDASCARIAVRIDGELSLLSNHPMFLSRID